MASRTRALSGKDANFLIGEHDFSDIFASVGLSTTRDKADVTVLADRGKAYVPGHFDGTLRLGGIFASIEDAELQTYVEEQSEPIISTLVLGSKKLDRAKLSQIVTSEYAIDTPVDDKSGISGAGQASGLMHHCVAISDVGQSITNKAGAGTTVILTDHKKEPKYIDIGENSKYKRIRVHVHLTTKGAASTAFRVKVESGNVAAANEITGPTERNGAAGVDIFDKAYYSYELKADEGSKLDRYWKVSVTAIGGTAASLFTAAFGRSQE